jgi:hypothetical protein
MLSPLLSAFAFGFGAIASKRSEDGGERAGVRASVKTNFSRAPKTTRSGLRSTNLKQGKLSDTKLAVGFIVDCGGTCLRSWVVSFSPSSGRLLSLKYDRPRIYLVLCQHTAG